MLVWVAKERRGFTLVELLVVIAILALLVSILLPALSKAQAQARTVECGFRLKNIGIATVAYATIYDDWLPLSSHNYYAGEPSPDRDVPYSWPHALSGELGHEAVVVGVGGAVQDPGTAYQQCYYRCNEQEARRRYAPPNPDPECMDYGLNFNVNFQVHTLKMGEIDSPASKLLYAETCGAQTAIAGNFNEVPCDPRVTSTAYITPRHLKGGENGSNICFGDGHVELVSEVEIPLLNEGMWLPTRR